MQTFDEGVDRQRNTLLTEDRQDRNRTVRWSMRYRDLALRIGLLGLVCLGANLQANESDPPPQDSAAIEEGKNIRSEREKVSAVEDGSIAEAVDRRPDLQFQNIKLDGEESAVSLSELSANTVSSLEVLRAVTPEMDADARGGSLVVRSKPTYELQKASTSITANTSYRSELGNQKNSVVVNHARSMGSYGFRINASVEDGEWGTASYNADWIQANSESSANLSRAAVQANVEDSAKYSVGGNLDWKAGDHLSLYFRGNYSLKDIDQVTRPTLGYRFSNGSAPLPIEATGAVERDMVSYESEWKEDSITFGGYLDYDQTEIDFRLLQNSRHIIEPDYFIVEFRKPDADLSYQLDKNSLPIFQNSANQENGQEFLFDEMQTGTWEQDRNEQIAAIDLRHKTRFLDGDTVLKTGVKWRKQDFDQSSDEQFFSGYDGDFHLSEVLGIPFEDSVIDGRYPLGPFPDDQRSRNFFAANQETFIRDERLSREASDPGTYNVTETVPAAYGMMDWKKNRWRLIGGIRFEDTQLEFLAREVVVDEAGKYLKTNIIEGNSEYDNFFPGFHLRYFLGKRTTIIASATRTIKRHFYGQIAPYRYTDFEDKTIREGNPSLRPTLFQNFDTAIDYKLSDNSVFALDLFHREITDTIYNQEMLLQEGPFSGFLQTALSNGPAATLTGIKATWTQSLEEWNKSLEGLSFNLNGTFQTSETEYPQRPGEKMEVTNTPGKSIQALMTLDRGNAYAQFSYLYTEGSLTSVSGVLWRDRFIDSAQQLDLKLSYRLSKQWRVLGEVKKRLDQSERTHLRDPRHLVQVNQDPRWIKIGLRWDG